MSTIPVFSSTMASSWWYDVALFPLVAVMRLLSQFGSRSFIIASSSGATPNVAAGIASFVLAVVSFWAGIFVALVVLRCLLADIRALGDDEHWSPSLVGVLPASRTSGSPSSRHYCSSPFPH